MNLRELIEDVDVPDTRVAEGTWERARGRVRRRRLVTTGAAGLAVATARSPSADARRSAGRRPGAARLADADRRSGRDGRDRPRLGGARRQPGALAHCRRRPAEREPRRPRVPGHGGPGRRRRCVRARRRRRLAAARRPGLQPVRNGTHIRALVRSTSLDETATRLAIPQPDGLFVVDLTTGDAERYDVPGQNTYALWHDASHVLVAGEPGATGTWSTSTRVGSSPRRTGRRPACCPTDRR